MKSAFELRDTTDDEIYRTLCFFSSLEKAIAHVEDWGNSPNLPNDGDEFQEIEIIQWEVDAPTSLGRTVWKRAWEWDYEDAGWAIA